MYKRLVNRVLVTFDWEVGHSTERAVLSTDRPNMTFFPTVTQIFQRADKIKFVKNVSFTLSSMDKIPPFMDDTFKALSNAILFQRRAIFI